MSPWTERISVVVLTCNRREEVCRTLTHIATLDGPRVIVVDNGSQDRTADRISRDFPSVTLIRLDRNMGAAARNVGAQACNTPYVAFCDDDAWWEKCSLQRAVEMMDAHSRVAVLNARVLIGAEQREDPICASMACSPLPSLGLPGKALAGFLAGACVVRKQAFLEAGGYEPKFFIGGEEALLALDFLAQHWALVYAPQLIVHHYPSSKRNASLRRHLLLRNAFWVAWLRLPMTSALRQSLRLCVRGTAGLPALVAAMREMPWVLQRRKVLPPRALAMYRLLERA